MKNHRSEALIDELIKAKIIKDRLCDRKKAQLIIRSYFCQIHDNAVKETLIATNKKRFSYPNFFD